jgi:hypothetical protein
MVLSVQKDIDKLEERQRFLFHWFRFGTGHGHLL